MKVNLYNELYQKAYTYIDHNYRKAKIRRCYKGSGFFAILSDQEH